VHESLDITVRWSLVDIGQSTFARRFGTSLVRCCQLG
jgi:hypothetical protein